VPPLTYKDCVTLYVMSE